MKMQRGFTLVELMITLAVAAILLTVAVPGFRDIIQNNRVTTQTNELVTALQLARSEGIKRGMTVSLCSSTNGAGCGGGWQQGWIVFTDANANGAVDAGTDQVLRVWEALSGGTNVVAAAAGGGALTNLRYDRLGAANLAGTFQLTIPDCTGNQNRTVAVAASGRVSTTRNNCP